MNTSQSEIKPISLALSGGGIRAMVFHLGVLRVLAERGLLEHVRRISTVSGGSLLIGLMLKEAEMQWPTSKQFLDEIYPNLRTKLCSRSLQLGALRQLLKLKNWQYLFSRANLLALALKHEWGITEHLGDLPQTLEWSINGTTAENGKRFRFKHNSIGDYTIGYAFPGKYPLANALAVSAAFPGGFGPLQIDTTEFQWFKRPLWNAPTSEAQAVDIGYTHLHLYDGGVYDNLGLEPLFDGGNGKPKHRGELIIVSDAGAPLKTGFSYFALNPFRLARVADIMSDQTRALRVRSFANFLKSETFGGAYLYINLPITEGLECKSSKFAAGFPTTLRKLKHSEFDLLAEHGYRVTLQVESQYGLIKPNA
jgi:NTE family protein